MGYMLKYKIVTLSLKNCHGKALEPRPPLTNSAVQAFNYYYENNLLKNPFFSPLSLETVSNSSPLGKRS